MGVQQMLFAVVWLLAGLSIAAPKTHKAPKVSTKQQSEPPKPVQIHHGFENVSSSGNVYTENWGGIVVSNSNINKARATFNVPKVSLTSGDTTTGSPGGLAWVGIDGGLSESGCSAIWQAGVGWVYENNAWNYYSWYEWVPGPLTQINLAVKPGDSVTFEVIATSTTGGVYKAMNHATGQRISGTLSGQQALCLETAEWIVENTNVEFAANEEMPNFRTITFTNAYYVVNGKTLGVNNGATNYAILDDNTIYSSTTTTGKSTVAVKWTDTAA